VKTNGPSPASIVVGNYRRLVESVAQACERAGRPAGSVQIVGVTKYVDAETASHLVAAGCIDLGESRPQSLAQKTADPQLQNKIRWHLIGHLQRNKVDITLATGALIHSVDSERLLRAIDKEGEKQNRIAHILFEVNCSGDDEKHGLVASQLPALLDLASEVSHVEVLGLMTMAAREGDSSIARQNFADLRELLERTQTTHSHLRLTQLSMGMSGDFAEAIAEGATIIRVGSMLWEGLG
jgi:PLP dependent protein